MKTLTLTQPDDWHCHLRDGQALSTTVPHTAAQFGRAIVMPNLTPPIVTPEAVNHYRNRILAALPPQKGDNHFQPLMTLYLKDDLTPEHLAQAKEQSHIVACKLYPAGATTGSAQGIQDFTGLTPLLEAMEQLNLVLCIHGEVTDPAVDIFDREKVFIERHLEPMVRQFPTLKIVLEHITTKEAADFVREGPKNLGATLTAHHLLINRNDLLVGGIKPHYYCLPIAKRQTHQEALLGAATSGSPKFFLGTDSAPHPQSQKESDCGCAGVYTAHNALGLYAEAFEAADALDKLEGFASFFGADFYGMPRNSTQLTLEKSPWAVPKSYEFAGDKLIPFRSGSTIPWRVKP